MLGQLKKFDAFSDHRTTVLFFKMMWMKTFSDLNSWFILSASQLIIMIILILF